MNNLGKYLILALFIIVILGAASCGCSRGTTPGGRVDIEDKKEVVLQYDRLWDESSVLDEIIDDYQDKHPNIKIVVRKINLGAGETIYDYQQDLIKQIADGAGPDIFMIHNNWLPYHKNHITPMPGGLMTTDEYISKFPQIVTDDFIDSNKIYAIPYYIDNLILFYNTDIFSDAKIRKPPETWVEVINLIPQLTKYGPNDIIEQSALPFGVADGISRSAEILATIMLQYGADMTTADHTKSTFDLPAPNSDPPYFSGQEALAFYTSFGDPTQATYTYTDAKNPDGSRKFPMDIQAFMEGKAAMFIGYSYQVANIKKFAPRVRFDTAPLPQLTRENPVVLANYWGETVSKNSKHPNEAWDFINFVTQKSKISKYLRATNRVPALKSKQEAYTDRRYYGAVAEQINFSQSWYRHNTLEIEEIFAQMINNVLHYEVSPTIAINTAANNINQLR